MESELDRYNLKFINSVDLNPYKECFLFNERGEKMMLRNFVKEFGVMSTDDLLGIRPEDTLPKDTQPENPKQELFTQLKREFKEGIGHKYITGKSDKISSAADSLYNYWVSHGILERSLEGCLGVVCYGLLSNKSPEDFYFLKKVDPVYEVYNPATQWFEYFNYKTLALWTLALTATTLKKLHDVIDTIDSLLCTQRFFYEQNYLLKLDSDRRKVEDQKLESIWHLAKAAQFYCKCKIRSFCRSLNDSMIFHLLHAEKFSREASWHDRSKLIELVRLTATDLLEREEDAKSGK